MRRKFSRWARWGSAGVVGLSLLSPPAHAQESKSDPQPPFDVNGLPRKKQILPWIFAFLFASLCLLVALKNPHRSHLD